jgi:hypothetical protein
MYGSLYCGRPWNPTFDLIVRPDLKAFSPKRLCEFAHILLIAVAIANEKAPIGYLPVIFDCISFMAIGSFHWRIVLSEQ